MAGVRMIESREIPATDTAYRCIAAATPRFCPVLVEARTVGPIGTGEVSDSRWCKIKCSHECPSHESKTRFGGCSQGLSLPSLRDEQCIAPATRKRPTYLQGVLRDRARNRRSELRRGLICIMQKQDTAIGCRPTGPACARGLRV